MSISRTHTLPLVTSQKNNALDNKEARKVSPNSFVPPAKLSSADSKKSTGSSLIPRNELLALARDFKNEIITREEALRQFVLKAIDNSLRNKLGEKDREQLFRDVTIFFDSDPNFVQDLEKNLNDSA